jgi:16S rRNA (uracil1498-N3)-methyltransferase
MSLPFFYVDSGLIEGTQIEPSEETARHIVQVLRMRDGEKIVITNGRGLAAGCTITSATKRNCTLAVGVVTTTPPFAHQVTIAISLLKNASRFEWFLEKAAETGINRIVPLLCSRTEKQHFRKDRAESILVSALQQSQQSWLTEIQEPVDFRKFFGLLPEGKKYIAHCMDQEKVSLAGAVRPDDKHSIILIGPEGDFTAEEVSLALEQGYKPVALGETRLRTETAGLVAAVLLRQTVTK